MDICINPSDENDRVSEIIYALAQSGTVGVLGSSQVLDFTFPADAPNAKKSARVPAHRPDPGGGAG